MPERESKPNRALDPGPSGDWTYREVDPAPDLTPTRGQRHGVRGPSWQQDINPRAAAGVPSGHA